MIDKAPIYSMYLTSMLLNISIVMVAFIVVNMVRYIPVDEAIA